MNLKLEMKKILQLLIALTLTFSIAESKAQLANGSIAPDFTFTDIAGHTQHLYALLDSGFTTYINVSATWSSSSWSYHHTGALDSLYKHHGPHGSNELRVLFIEGEISNDSIQLYGITTSQSYSGLSRGNFVNGTLYPIIDFDSAKITSASAFLSGYNIQSFPAIYLICPDRSVTLVGEQSTANLYAAKSSCSAATVAVDAEMIPCSSFNIALTACDSSLAPYDSVTPTFRLGNVGSTALTSAKITLNVDGITQKTINWTGPLATYGSTLITGVKVGAANAGTHIITAIVSNPNGTTDPTIINDTAKATFTLYPKTGGSPIVQNFETAGIPSSWVIANGGTTYTWENAIVGQNSSKSAKLRCYFIPAGEVNTFTLDAMSFAGVTAPGLTFDVAYATNAPTDLDKLEVQSSVDCGATWTTHYSKSGSGLATRPSVSGEFAPTSPWDWRNELVQMHLDTGYTSVLVRFKATSNYGNDIYIDNINVAASAGINEISNISAVNIYPNPVLTNATIDFTLSETSDVSILLNSIIGEEIMKTELSNVSINKTTYQINTEGIRSGLYFVMLKTSKGEITKKLIVNH